MPAIGATIERRSSASSRVAQRQLARCASASSASVTCTAVAVFEVRSALHALELGRGVVARDLGAVDARSPRCRNRAVAMTWPFSTMRCRTCTSDLGQAAGRVGVDGDGALARPVPIADSRSLMVAW